MMAVMMIITDQAVAQIDCSLGGGISNVGNTVHADCKIVGTRIGVAMFGTQGSSSGTLDVSTADDGFWFAQTSTYAMETQTRIIGLALKIDVLPKVTADIGLDFEQITSAAILKDTAVYSNGTKQPYVVKSLVEVNNVSPTIGVTYRTPIMTGSKIIFTVSGHYSFGRSGMRSESTTENGLSPPDLQGVRHAIPGPRESQHALRNEVGGRDKYVVLAVLSWKF